MITAAVSGQASRVGRIAYTNVLAALRGLQTHLGIPQNNLKIL